jgi:hypothetical protein
MLLIPQPEIQELLFAVQQPTQCQAPEIYHSAIGDKFMFSIFCWATGSPQMRRKSQLPGGWNLECFS